MGVKYRFHATRIIPNTLYGRYPKPILSRPSPVAHPVSEILLTISVPTPVRKNISITKIERQASEKHKGKHKKFRYSLMLGKMLENTRFSTNKYLSDAETAGSIPVFYQKTVSPSVAQC